MAQTFKLSGLLLGAAVSIISAGIGAERASAQGPLLPLEGVLLRGAMVGLEEAAAGRAAIGALERGAVAEGLESVAARTTRRPLNGRSDVRIYNNTFKFAPELSLAPMPSHQPPPIPAPEAQASANNVPSWLHVRAAGENGYGPPAFTGVDRQDRTECYANGNAANCDHVPPGWRVIRTEQVTDADRELIQRAYKRLGPDEPASSNDYELVRSAYKCVGSQCEPTLTQQEYELVRERYKSLGTQPVRVSTNSNVLPSNWEIIRENPIRVEQRTECYANGNAPNCDNVPPGWRVIRR